MMNQPNYPNDSSHNNPWKHIQQILQYPGVQENRHLMFLIQSYQQFPLRTTWNSIQLEFEQFKKRQGTPGQVRPVQAHDFSSQEGFVLGKDPQTGYPVTLTWEDLMKNLIAAGAMGVGKTTLLRHLVRQCLARKINSLLFQKKQNQYEYLDNAITLLRLDQVRDALFEYSACGREDERLHQYRTAVSLINDIAQRQDSAKYTNKALPLLIKQWPLERIHREGFPTIKDLLRCMEWVYQNEGAKKDPRLYRSIFTVWETLWDETEVFRAQKGMYSALRNHPTVVQYDVSEEQLAWIVILLQVNRVLVENNRLPPENKKPFLVLVDDAQDMVKVNRDTRIAPFINYMNIGRENLCSIFLSFQTTHEINEQLLASAGTLILGRLPNGEEALRMTRILGLDRSYAHILQTLPSGQFLLRTPSSNGVFMLQTEMFDASFPTNLEQWEQENHRRIKDLYTYQPYPAASCERDQSKADSQVSPSAFRVLTEVFNHPFSILSDVQASLRFSSSSFAQAVRELEKRKWIRRVEFSRCKTLEILAGGYRAIGQTPPQYNGRFPHAFGVHWIEKKFQAEGWSTRREDTLPGSTHRIDLVAIKHPEIWAIEYETGASDILLNLTNCLETNASKILFVLISDALHKKMRGEIRRSEKFSKVLADGRIILDTLWNYIQSDSQKNSK